MRFKDFKISDPVEDLANKLPKLKLTNYDTIDELMTKISKRYKITGKKLHDLFVHKYGHTPDVWIKKIKQRNEQEEMTEAQGEIYILFIDGKPAAKYTDIARAQADIQHLQRKFPNKKFELEQEVCRMEPVNTQVNESLIDLTKNYQNYTSVIGKILDKSPTGKVTIQIVSASPSLKKGAVKVGDVVKIHSNYLKNAPIMNEEVESDQHLKQINDFIKWALKELHIEKPYPKIILSKDTDKAQAGTHTGYHTEEPGRKTIWVYIANRNLIDIFRTIFHELVHERQTQLGMIKQGDSYPGSPIEALADMVAGKYIKIYGKKHPEIFQ